MIGLRSEAGKGVLWPGAGWWWTDGELPRDLPIIPSSMRQPIANFVAIVLTRTKQMSSHDVRARERVTQSMCYWAGRPHSRPDPDQGELLSLLPDCYQATVFEGEWWNEPAGRNFQMYFWLASIWKLFREQNCLVILTPTIVNSNTLSVKQRLARW